MKSRLQLLAILKYIMEESSENSPVGYSEIIDFLFSKEMCPTKNTLKEDKMEKASSCKLPFESENMS